MVPVVCDHLAHHPLSFALVFHEHDILIRHPLDYREYRLYLLWVAVSHPIKSFLHLLSILSTSPAGRNSYLGCIGEDITDFSSVRTGRNRIWPHLERTKTITNPGTSHPEISSAHQLVLQRPYTKYRCLIIRRALRPHLCYDATHPILVSLKDCGGLCIYPLPVPNIVRTYLTFL